MPALVGVSYLAGAASFAVVGAAVFFVVVVVVVASAVALAVAVSVLWLLRLFLLLPLLLGLFFFCLFLRFWHILLFCSTRFYFVLFFLFFQF